MWAFRVLGAGNFPSHRTLCAFRRRHLEDLQGVVRGGGGFGSGAGSGELREAVDRRDEGSSEREQAQGDELWSDGRGGAPAGGGGRSASEARLGTPIWRKTRALARRFGGMSCRRSCIGAKTGWRRSVRRRRVWRRGSGRRTTRAAASRGMTRKSEGGRAYEREYGEPAEKAQDNFTDPESRIMKTSQEGFQQCYNAQVAVEGGNQLIVAPKCRRTPATRVIWCRCWTRWRPPTGSVRRTVLADAGYCNEADLVTLEGRGVDGHVALGREADAPLRWNATKHPAKARMAAKLSTDAGRVQYAQRKWLSEAPNGWIKQALGFRRVQSARPGQGAGEWDLVLSGIEHQADAGPPGGLKTRLMIRMTMHRSASITTSYGCQAERINDRPPERASRGSSTTAWWRSHGCPSFYGANS